MIGSKIPGVDKDFDDLRQVATSGFVLALNVSWIGPEFLQSEYPQAWREIYEESGYFMLDPIYYWTVMHTGTVRWSEVKYPDIRSVKKHAAEFGLVFGATVSMKHEGRKSFLTCARPDREFTDAEIERFETLLIKWNKVVIERPILTEVELSTLRSLRDGLDQNQIAATLEISVSTVKKRLSSVRRKFKAATVAEALAIAVEKKYFSDA